jgi:hypothetical protein
MATPWAGFRKLLERLLERLLEWLLRRLLEAVRSRWEAAQKAAL